MEYARFPSSVELERLELGSQVYKGQRDPTDIWVKLRLFVINPERRCHCYCQAVGPFSLGLVITWFQPSFTRTQRKASFYPGPVPFLMSHGSKLEQPRKSGGRSTESPLPLQRCCKASSATFSHAQKHIFNGTVLLLAHFQCYFGGATLVQSAFLINATLMWFSMCAFKRGSFLAISINYSVFLRIMQEAIQHCN